MQEIKIDSYREYLHYFQNHPEECTALLDTVLINVTSFFRDSEAQQRFADRDAWVALTDKSHLRHHIR